MERLAARLAALSLSARIALTNVLLILGLAGATIVVQEIALRAELERQAVDRQEASMRVAWEVFRGKGDTVAVTDGKLTVGSHVVNNDFTIVDRVQKLVGGVATVFMGDLRVSTNVIKEDGTRAVGTPLAQGPIYDAVLKNGVPFRGPANILGESYYAGYDPIRDASGKVVGVLFVGVKKSDFFAAVESQRVLTILVVLVLAAVALAVNLWLLRRSLRPLGQLSDAIIRLGRNEVGTAIPHEGLPPELAAMADAAEVLRRNTEERIRLQAAREEEDARSRRRITTIDGLTAAFDRTVAGVLDATDAATRNFDAMAASLRGIADETANRAVSSATASEQTSSNVETVAAATEELSASTREIGQQVQDSARIARAAVEEALRTNDTVQGLSAAADRIGHVVGLIQEIAAQTNLLALNATIEAARAGEAGKGFAVVASEVKALANQTAKATEQIADEVAAIQRATGQAVAAISGIGGTIRKVDEITTGIAGAVEQQAAATAEISRSVQEASTGSRIVYGNVMDVKSAAARTDVAAGDVQQAARSLAAQSATLRQEVESFLKGIRAA